MSNWPGIEIILNNDTGFIYTFSADARETENPPLNSAYGVYDPSVVVNLYDGKWHNILYMWSMNDGQPTADLAGNSFPGYAFGTGVSALQKGVLVVDGNVIGNQQGTWSGKKTAHTFLHDNVNGTYVTLGARTNSNGSSALASSTNVDQVFAGIIQRAVVWDRPLTSAETDIHITSSYSPSTDMLLYTSLIGKTDTSQSSLWDPLSGTLFKSLSSNVVLYHKFDELTVNANTSQDKSGTASGGSQTKPGVGNPVAIIGVDFETGSYLIQDIPNIEQDDVMKTGILTFTDENFVTRKVGFINYDLGTVVFDGEYNNSGSGLPLLSQIGNKNFTFNSTDANNFLIKSLNFTSQQFIERLMVNVGASGEEMNISENPTALDETTGQQILNPSASYITGIGFYNDRNELVAIAKLSQPIRKDTDHNVITQTRFDF